MISKIQEEVVQGPLEHARFGRCLVVRPTIETTRADRFPTQAMVVTTAARRIIELSKDGQKLKAIVVANEERDPTLHPEFAEISQNLRELCAKWFPKAKFCLVSDAPELSRSQVRHALIAYDLPVLHVVAGTVKTATAFAGESGKHVRQTVEDLGKIELDRLIVEGRFVRGTVDNSQDNEVKAWIRNISELKPATIQVTTPAKASGGNKPVTKTRMTQIADLVGEKTGVPVEVHEI